MSNPGVVVKRPENPHENRHRGRQKGAMFALPASFWMFFGECNQKRWLTPKSAKPPQKMIAVRLSQTTKPQTINLPSVHFGVMKKHKKYP